jgi:hypothetical protein
MAARKNAARKPSSRRAPSALAQRSTAAGPAPAPTGCKYSVTWKRLASTRGYVQVWVAKKTYDDVVKQLGQRAPPDAKRKLRLRAQPLGVTTTCGGTCEGGWCKEVMIEGDDTGGSFICQCAYFV